MKKYLKYALLLLLLAVAVGNIHSRVEARGIYISSGTREGTETTTETIIDEPGVEPWAEPGENPENEPGDEPGGRFIPTETEETTTEDPTEQDVAIATAGDILNGDRTTEKTSVTVWIVLIAIIVIIVALVVVIISISNRKNTVGHARENGNFGEKNGQLDANNLNVDPSVPAMEIFINVYAGEYAPKKRYLLRDCLTIGSDKSADIVFAQADVEPVHAKLKVENGGLYLVDCSTSGTYIDGMRIQMQNRLDVGDVISVGSAQFAIEIHQKNIYA